MTATKKHSEHAIARALEAETAATTAMALAKRASETAEALAQAKVQSDISHALLAADLTRIKSDLTDIKTLFQGSSVSKERLDSIITDLSTNVKQAELHALRITALEKAQYENVGKGDGMKALWGWIAAGVSLTIMVFGFLIQNLRFK